jgi:hypothetical protein
LPSSRIISTPIISAATLTKGWGRRGKSSTISATLRGQPQNAHLYHVRGRNYLRLQEHAKAGEDLNRALELKPADQAPEK